MEAKICQLYTIRDSNRARGTDAVSSFPVGGKRLMYWYRTYSTSAMETAT